MAGSGVTRARAYICGVGQCSVDFDSSGIDTSIDFGNIDKESIEIDKNRFFLKGISLPY